MHVYTTYVDRLVSTAPPFNPAQRDIILAGFVMPVTGKGRE